MTEGPPVVRVRTPVFLLLAAGAISLAVSIGMYGDLLATNHTLWGHTDEWIYRAAGLVLRHHPGRLYTIKLAENGDEPLPFAYPPFAALIFKAFSGFSFGVWQTGLVVIDFALLPVIAFASLRIAGVRGRTGYGWALIVAAIAIWFEPVYMTMFFGQINLIELALIVVDLALPDRSRFKGVGIGIAAGLKLTPLVFIPYLFLTRRRRAALVALVSFGATVGIGYLLVPRAAGQYWGGKFSTPGDNPAWLVNQSINGFFQRILHHHATAATTSTQWLVTAVLVGLAGLAVATLAGRRGQEMLGVLACAVTGLLVSPVSWTHHWIWVVPALALALSGPWRVSRRIWAARAGGLAALALFVMWPTAQPIAHTKRTRLMPGGWLRLVPHSENEFNGQEYHWHGLEIVFGNYYTLTALVFIAATAGYLWFTRHRGAPAGPEPDAPADPAEVEADKESDTVSG